MASMGFNPFARHTENQPSKPNDQEKSASTPEPQTPTDGQRTFHVVNSVASTPEPRAATAGNAAETEERPPARPVAPLDDQSGPAAPTPPSSAAHASKAVNPFASYETEPKYRRREPEQLRKPPALELLVWIRRHWNKPIISLRDIQTYAPRDYRDRQSATKHAETLEQHGWLAPLRPRRHDRRVWRTPPAWASELPED